MDNNFRGKFAAVWGFGGAFALIAFAVWRLTPVAIESLTYPLTTLQWTALIANIIYMLHAEGYKGFQQAFAPRVAARTLYIHDNPTTKRVILAPLFIMGYFDSTRKRMLVTYALTTMIITLVIIVRQIDQPWRGIIDAGVVAGLIWGLTSMLYFIRQALSSKPYNFSPEVEELSTQE